MSCKGKGCSLKSKKVAHKGGTVNLLKTLKKLRCARAAPSRCASRPPTAA